MTQEVNGGNAKTLKVKLIKSVIGRPEDQRATVKALGLKKMNHTVTVPDNPCIRGMINKLRHMVEVQEA